MDPRDERRIERFVHRPEEMTEEERLRVKRLLEKDSGAAQYAAFLRDFYERLIEEHRRSSDSRVDAFVDELFGEDASGSPEEEDASVVPVRPLGSGPRPRPTVLATDAPAAPARDASHVEPSSGGQSGSEKNRFVVLAVLTSPDETVLVRVVGDRKTGRGRLYVLPGSSEETRREEPHVVVSFPELGRHIVTDEDGRASFALHTENEAESQVPNPRERWSDVTAVVRRPVATETLPPGEKTIFSGPAGDPPPTSISENEDSGTGKTGNESSSRLLCRREGGTLSITVNDENTEGFAFLAVTGPEDDPALISLRSGRPAPQALPHTESLTLRVYE